MSAVLHFPSAEYREPDWPKVRVRCLKPFRYRKELRRGMVTLVLEEARTLDVGEVVELIEPEALDVIARGRAERVT